MTALQHGAPHQGGAPALAPVLLPLLGTPCAVCGHPARYVTAGRHVIHVDILLRPCLLPPIPAMPAVPADFAEVTR
ncbi:hypothetical protein [Saccharopolyspora sp. NPDC002376]